MSFEATQKLGLAVTPHPSPYPLAWLNNSTEITVSKQVLVSFSIGTYKDSVTCDVIPMDACHLLLGRPWQFDRDAIHRGKGNTYSFVFDNRTITLVPSKERPDPSARSEGTNTKDNTSSAKSLLTLPKANLKSLFSMLMFCGLLSRLQQQQQPRLNLPHHLFLCSKTLVMSFQTNYLAIYHH